MSSQVLTKDEPSLWPSLTPNIQVRRDEQDSCDRILKSSTVDMQRVSRKTILCALKTRWCIFQAP